MRDILLIKRKKKGGGNNKGSAASEYGLVEGTGRGEGKRRTVYLIWAKKTKPRCLKELKKN